MAGISSFNIGWPVKIQNGKKMAFRRVFVLKFPYFIQEVRIRVRFCVKSFVPKSEGHR